MWIQLPSRLEQETKFERYLGFVMAVATTMRYAGAAVHRLAARMPRYPGIRRSWVPDPVAEVWKATAEIRAARRAKELMPDCARGQSR